MGKIFISIGSFIFILGLLIHFYGNKLGWFGNLYGDLKIIKSNYNIYFPITSMIIVSIILSLIINIISRFIK